MITHVIVELKYPVEDEYFLMDTVFPNEYYGYGTPLVRCKDCKYWRANTQFCSVFSGLCTAHRMPPNGYCSEAERKEL